MSLDWDKPMQTKGGQKFRLLCRDCRSECGPVVGLVERGSEEVVSLWRDDGTHSTQHREWDLVNVPAERWVNLYGEAGMDGEFCLHSSKEVALSYAATKVENYIGTFRLTEE